LASDPISDCEADQEETNVRQPTALLALALLGATVIVAPPTEARITRIEITRVESPTFEGTTFGDVGRYEKLVGRVFGEVDPKESGNAVIADIALAPRNAHGMVEYATDVYILRPVDPSKGNRRLLYEVNNRGTNLSFLALHGTAINNDPTKAADAGNGFLMRAGYTLVWSGWDVTAAPGDGRFTMTVPVAKNPDGSPIVGPAMEEFVFDEKTRVTGRLTYPAATLDTAKAALTVRTRYADPPTAIPATGWEFVDSRTVRLRPAGSPFEPGRIYQFVYPATEPLVAGLAFAGVRDVLSFLRHTKKHDMGPASPLGGYVERVYAFTISQPGRFMRDFVHLGFNRDEQGEQVIDGILNWIAGGSGGFFNFRFAQPFRTQRQHIGRWYPEREFPFAYQVLADPVTGKRDGRLARCNATNTCPKIFEANSSNEYWVKTGSLVHTDIQGRDLGDPPNVRYYHFAGYAHSPASETGICQQPRNPLRAGAGLRALLVALDEWVSSGTEPPESRLPRQADGTLVASLPQTVAGFPSIPGVTYSGLMTTGDLWDFGADFDKGILTTLPPRLRGSPYPAFVPKVDGDGNEIAGVRFPAVAVPVATYTGWALRSKEFAGDDYCDAFGQAIPFAKTKVEREAKGDPRLSLEERYPSRAKYVEDVTRVARTLRLERFMLDEDVEGTIKAAEASTVGK
jgi:hypothetical protein